MGPDIESAMYVYMKVSVTACFKNDFHSFDCGGYPPCTLYKNLK
ncbi:hypothetical protein MTBBW1_500006 [Desulfamplus magnetovallimortis]|uniref:Uncharacterized protein n=1 Tax=Desulfamplus magnetovallimortis TaxID=1246637 RepID=A0A1W1HHG1_9BACT|nr:hypothetical protein MTBBW1_500006 [Desulfamplus magnetovallimortis]